MSSARIAYAGMTHLGICSAVAAAAKGFSVVCFDQDTAAVEALRRRQFPIFEPDLEKHAAEYAGRLSFTSEATHLTAADVCFVAADVPTDSAGRSDQGPIRRLVDIVDANLPSDATMVVLSQVPPGFARSLSRRPERRFCQVETLIFGQAMTRALHPERFMVGCADPARPLPSAYAEFLGVFGCPILPMRYESAELAKISINMFLVSSVSTTNTIAELCERVGADWQEIAPALRLDRRIGPHAYLAPGLGIGGGNLERDLVTFTELAQRHGTDIGVLSAWVANSTRRRTWALDTLKTQVLPNAERPVVAVLGLAYKQDTASTRNSAGVSLLKSLPAGFTARAYDPVVSVDPEWGKSVVQSLSAAEACRGADVALIMTPWSEFKTLEPGSLAQTMRGNLVIDPYGVLDAAACKSAGLKHVQLGRG